MSPCAPVPARPVEEFGVARDVATLGRLVGVWAHPDAETYLSGGLMAAAADNGQPTWCITATAGEHGTDDPKRWPPRRLSRRRRHELRHALDVLGVRHHHWLGYTDGGLINVDVVRAVDRLLGLIEQLEPDTIVTFGPDGFTGHTNHRVVSQWTTRAVAIHGSVNVLHAAKITGWIQTLAPLHDRFPIFYPGYPQGVHADRLAVDLCLDDDALDRNVRALCAHATQTAPIVAATGLPAWREWIRRESLIDGSLAGTRSNGVPRDTNTTATTIVG
jgi:LmbE family N-acetylglucosaminyl deacetylase